MLVGMGLLCKRVHLAQYLAHISPSISPNPPGTRTSRGVPWGLPLSQHTCVSKGLFNLHGPLQARSDLQGSCFQAFMFTFFAGVPCGRNARAHTDTKEGKAQANHGFCRGLSLLSWQRSKAGVHTVFTNPTSQMIWFLASVGLLLVGCCCCCFCCCCAVPFCCGFAGAGWLLLLVNYCWLAGAGWLLLLVSCCWFVLLLFGCCWFAAARLAAAVWPLLVGCCWLPSAAVGLLVLFLLLLAAACCCLCLLLQSLLICCWLLLRKPYHCGSVVNWAWKA